MAKTDRRGDHQYAALPYRTNAMGGLEVLLLTSRDTGRWVVPKGWPIKGKKGRNVAALEAREEAGVSGIVGKKPLGSYPYAKVLADGDERLVLVTVYPMLVKEELSVWPEASERQRTWFPKSEAASLVSEGSLAILIEELG